MIDAILLTSSVVLYGCNIRTKIWVIKEFLFMTSSCLSFGSPYETPKGSLTYGVYYSQFKDYLSHPIEIYRVVSP